MEFDVWDNEDLATRFLELTEKVELDDEEWLPPRLKKARSQQKGKHCVIDIGSQTYINILEHPNEYIKEPDVMSKSAHTQHHYWKTWSSQTQLDGFFKLQAVSTSSEDGKVVCLNSSESSSDSGCGMTLVTRQHKPLVLCSGINSTTGKNDLQLTLKFYL